MAAVKMVGFRTVLKCSTDGSTTYGITLGQIISISGPNVSANDIDLSTLDSTSIFMQFAKGMVDPGEVVATVAWDGSTDTGQKAAHELLRNQIVAGWKMIFPTTTITEEFMGYVKGIGREVSIQDLISAPITIKVTGDSATRLPFST